MLEQDVIDAVTDDGYDGGERYAIVVTPGEKPRIIDEVQQAIHDDIFWRDHALVTVRRKDGECILEPMSREALDDLINRRCLFEKHVVSKKSGHVSTALLDAPKYVSETIHGLGHWPLLREIKQVTSVPFLRPDGSVGGLEPGYDKASKVYANVSVGLWAPPEQPSLEEAMEALRTIREIVDEFPFASEAYESVYVAAILTIVARRHLPEAVPLFVVEASKSGSGKTLLARIITMIGTGSDPGLASIGRNEAEFRKMITSFLLSGQAVLVLDNQTGQLGGENLDRLQTSGHWSDRSLGHNRVVTLRNDIVTIVTSNNTVIAGDTTRRSLAVRLVPDCEHPEYRVFRNSHLLRDVHRRRHELAIAAITILRWHISTGCPAAGARPFGSFEAWSRLVRDAIINLGMQDPVETQRAIQDLDEQHLAEKQFVLSWAEWNPKWTGMADELIRAIETSQQAAPVRVAMVGMCGDDFLSDQAAAAKKLGYKLRSLRDRRFDGWAIVKAGGNRRGICWGLDLSEASGDSVIGGDAVKASPRSENS